MKCGGGAETHVIVPADLIHKAVDVVIGIGDSADATGRRDDDIEASLHWSNDMGS